MVTRETDFFSLLYRNLFNSNLFNSIHIGKKLHQAKSSYKDPVGNVIKEKEHIKDLGVIISDDLTWSKHIMEVVSKARVMSG